MLSLAIFPAAAGADEFRFGGGDIENGKITFSSVGCNVCHPVKGVEIPKAPKPRLELSLAQELRFVKGYEDLLTAITNPRHVMNERYRALLEQSVGGAGDVEPFMPNFVESLTVKQLIDLAAFLDAAYKEALPAYGKK